MSEEKVELTDEQVISAALVYSGGARPVQKLCERLLARNARIKELEALLGRCKQYVSFCSNLGNTDGHKKAKALLKELK